MGDEADVYNDPEQREIDALLVQRSITLREGQWLEIQEILFGYGMDEIAHAMAQPDAGRRSRLKRMGERLQGFAALLSPPSEQPRPRNHGGVGQSPLAVPLGNGARNPDHIEWTPGIKDERVPERHDTDTMRGAGPDWHR